MNNKLIAIIVVALIGVVAFIIYFSSSGTEDSPPGISQCEVDEMIFYYRNDCSWCQKVKKENTISKIEALGVNVKSVNTEIGPVRHEFRGVPTFVINNRIYSGYKTFSELREFLVCLDEEQQPKDDFHGEEGEEVNSIGSEVILDASILEDGLAHFYNVELDNKKVYFFVIKDKAGVYRAAANACQVCFDSRMGFRQEGDFMVCNTCGNKYPLEKIATEKGGCNPGPISPNLEVRDSKVVIEQKDIQEVVNFF